MSSALITHRREEARNGSHPREETVNAMKGAPMGALKPEHPEDAGLTSEVPDQSHIEGAELLANEARAQLRVLGFTDDEILEWAETYIAEEGSGDLESLLTWIEERES